MKTIRNLAIAVAAAAGVTVAVAGCGGGGSTPVTAPTATPAPAVAQSVTTGISASAALFSAVDAPDGRIWFSEFGANNLAAVTTAGIVTEYPMPASSQPNGITVGADGNVWTGGYGGVLLKVTSSGSYTPYTVAGAHFGALTLGPDKNVWFADYGLNEVGNVTTSGTVTTYAAPAGTQPGGIASGPDGNLWVADGAGSILRVTPTGTFTKFTAGLSAGASPNAIVAGPDGNLYFTEPTFGKGNDHIGRITTSGTITEIGSLAPNTYPSGLAVGKNGNLYFSEYDQANLGFVNVSAATISEIPLGLPLQGSAIVNGPDNRLWLGFRQSIAVLAY